MPLSMQRLHGCGSCISLSRVQGHIILAFRRFHKYKITSLLTVHPRAKPNRIAISRSQNKSYRTIQGVCSACARIEGELYGTVRFGTDSPLCSFLSCLSWEFPSYDMMVSYANSTSTLKNISQQQNCD